MNSRNLGSGMLVVLILLMVGCATMQTAGHQYIMRGQVLEVTGDSAYLCIGSNDGAKVGQEFTVYRFERTPVSGKSHIPNFRRDMIGKIRITEIVDEHMATAKVLAGKVAANDIVELNP